MRATTALATAIIITWTAPLPAQIYRCETDRGPIFSQQPCAADAAKVEIAPGYAAPPDASDRLRDLQDQVHLNHQRATHNNRIARLRNEIRNLENDRDRELAQIESKRRTAANNLAGATYLNALANDAQQIVNLYNPQIQGLRAELATLERTRP